MIKPETTLIIGPSGCGKTWIMLNEILLKEKNGEYDYIIIICSTLWINDTYINWRPLWHDNDVISLQIEDVEKLNDIILAIVKIFSGCKVAVVVDDISHDSLQHKNAGSQLSYLEYSGRHHNFSLFILSQKLNSISTGLRDNCTRLIFFKTHNRKSADVMSAEFLGGYSAEESKKIMSMLNKKRYVDIDLTTGKYNVR